MIDRRPDLAVRLAAAREDRRPLIIDGGLGTELDERGADTKGPAWSGTAPLDHPALLERIHRDYLDAGADVITTCTFRTTRRAFRDAGLPERRWRTAAAAAVAIARRSRGPGDALIAGSIAPLEDCFAPARAPSGERARHEHALLASELVAAGVDVLWLETFGTAREVLGAAAAAAAAGELHGIPFTVSLVTGPDGRLLSGEPLDVVVVALEQAGAAALALNCVPPWFVDRALGRLLELTRLPVGVYANLGRAEAGQGWDGHAGVEPADYAELARGWVARGASLVGGCCGSTPAHIAALRAALVPTSR